MQQNLQIAGRWGEAQAIRVDLSTQVDELERAITRMGVRLREEELPEEAHVDGGLCKTGDGLVLYVAPAAPPWRRVQVLLDALRRLPHGDIWLPPEIRALVAREDCGDASDGLLG